MLAVPEIENKDTLVCICIIGASHKVLRQNDLPMFDTDYNLWGGAHQIFTVNNTKLMQICNGKNGLKQSWHFRICAQWMRWSHHMCEFVLHRWALRRLAAWAGYCVTLDHGTKMMWQLCSFTQYYRSDLKMCHLPGLNCIYHQPYVFDPSLLDSLPV